LQANIQQKQKLEITSKETSFAAWWHLCTKFNLLALFLCMKFIEEKSISDTFIVLPMGKYNKI